MNGTALSSPPLLDFGRDRQRVGSYASALRFKLERKARVGPLTSLLTSFQYLLDH